MSKLARIKEKLASMLAEIKASTIKTDKAIISWDGDEELVEGMDVYAIDENGERVAIEDGEYVTEDNKVITIAGGKVVSIVEKEEVEPGQETPTEETEVNAEEVETPEETEPIEEPVETPNEIEELKKAVDKLYEVVEDIVNKIGLYKDEVDAKFSKIEKMSLAKPADEVFETSTTTKLTGDVKVDKKIARAKELNRDWRA